MQSLTTTIGLPPGIPSGPVVHELLKRVFETYRWLRPMRYGYASLKQKVDPERIDYGALRAFYEELHSLTVGARTDRDLIMISATRADDPPHIGTLTWDTSVKEAEKASWRTAHAQQVAEVMQMMGSPLAQAGTDEDVQRKRWRLVPNPDGFGRRQVPTVRDYSEGLAGVCWRNFFGPPFVRLFGERLASLPEGCTKEELGGGIVLVQPYGVPTLAGTEEGIARERALIEHLGPECFYDHEHHFKPTRLPDLPLARAITARPGQA